MYSGARCVKKCKLTFTKWWKKLTAKNLFMIVFSCNFNLVGGRKVLRLEKTFTLIETTCIGRSVSRKFCRILTRPKIIDTLTLNHSLWICRDYDVIIKVIQILNICHLSADQDHDKVFVINVWNYENPKPSNLFARKIIPVRDELNKQMHLTMFNINITLISFL